MNNVATAVDETSSSSMMVAQAFRKVKKEDTSSDSDSDSNNSFFDDWGQGNWCWERDYNKYPVVSFPNSHCHDDDGNSNDIDIDIEDNEKKPAAIKSSSSIDSDRVTTTASSEIDMTKTKIETQKISIRRNSQIKVENKNEENTNDINSIVNNSNNEDNDDDDDDDDDIDVNDDSSFYDDWVEGNWCLLDKYDKSNNSGSGDSTNPPRGIRHGIRTRITRSRKDTCVDNNNNNSNESAKIDLKRSRYDDDEDDEESDCEDNNDDNEEEEEDFLPKDNNDAGNYRANNRPSRKKKSRRRIQYDQVWMKMFQKLVTYRKLHKNTLVPRLYKEDPKLGRWVYSQRQNYKNDDILPNRLALLNSIYFKLEGAAAARDQMTWMNMYQKIVAYKKMHKNNTVPFHYQEDPKLGHWVSQQRKKYKNEELLPERVDLLKTIGFEWDGEKYDELWMGMFQKLVAYKDMHENCMVPSHYQEDLKLGHWVSRQRKKYKNDSLLPNRLTLLNSIDFEWVWIGSVKRKKSQDNDDSGLSSFKQRGW